MQKQIEYLNAKDGLLTCKINSLFLHSSYSPIKESERFSQTLKTPFKPDILFLIEPGLSYQSEKLREIFPETKLCAIRFCKDFKKYDILFDYAFYYEDFTTSLSLWDKVYSTFGENTLAYSFIAVWEPAAKIFPEETMELLKSFKNLIEKCHSILRTRSFFEKRWIKNSVKLATNIRQISILKEKGNCPVVVCASGPSLKESIPFLKEQKPFIIAVSSGLRPLVQNGITPDLVLSTDGGFWAKKHLFPIPEKTKIALAVESNCPTKEIKSRSIIPLIYNDGVESDIFKASGIKNMMALRCGTVSGTALNLAEQLTSGDIYFAGLDLSVCKGFQHTQKNNLEIENSCRDNKKQPIEKRICTQEFSNQKQSLKIYEDWFKEQKFHNRKVYRIISTPANTLGEIKDLKAENLRVISFEGKKPVFESDQVIYNRDKIENYIKSSASSDDWLKNVFTADYLNYLHTNDENQKEAVFNKMTEENQKLLENLCRLFTKTK